MINYGYMRLPTEMPLCGDLEGAGTVFFLPFPSQRAQRDRWGFHFYPRELCEASTADQPYDSNCGIIWGWYVQDGSSHAKSLGCQCTHEIALLWVFKCILVPPSITIRLEGLIILTPTLWRWFCAPFISDGIIKVWRRSSHNTSIRPRPKTHIFRCEAKLQKVSPGNDANALVMPWWRSENNWRTINIYNHI